MDFISLEADSDDLTNTSTIGMAVCHTLHKARDGGLVGNHVDVVSFQHTGADLIQNDGAPTLIKMGGQTFKVIKQYEFDSHLQTSSVIVEDSSTGKTTVFVKGSPEAIRKLCIRGCSWF